MIAHRRTPLAAEPSNIARDDCPQRSGCHRRPAPAFDRPAFPGPAFAAPAFSGPAFSIVRSSVIPFPLPLLLFLLFQTIS